MSTAQDTKHPSLNVNLDDIAKLIDMLKDTDVKKVSISPDGAVEVTMKSHELPPTAMVASAPVLPPQPLPSAPAAAPAATPAATTKNTDDAGHQIRSPMVGTVYLSPSPGAQPFATVGQTVKKGDVLCLVEAMKMFNKIKADRTGKLLKCCIEDAQPVEFDQPLFVIEE